MSNQPDPYGPRLIYVAGPYTHPDPVENTRKAMLAAHFIYEKTGIPAYAPHLSLFQHFLMPQPLEWWYEYDLRIVEKCDAVYRLDGKSNGADKEVEHAEGLKIPVFWYYSNLFDWVKDPTPWRKMQNPE